MSVHEAEGARQNGPPAEAVTGMDCSAGIQEAGASQRHHEVASSVDATVATVISPHEGAAKLPDEGWGEKANEAGGSYGSECAGHVECVGEGTMTVNNTTWTSIFNFNSYN